jgi:hypothetical protein
MIAQTRKVSFCKQFRMTFGRFVEEAIRDPMKIYAFIGMGIL